MWNVLFRVKNECPELIFIFERRYSMIGKCIRLPFLENKYKFRESAARIHYLYYNDLSSSFCKESCFVFYKEMSVNSLLILLRLFKVSPQWKFTNIKFVPQESAFWHVLRKTKDSQMTLFLTDLVASNYQACILGPSVKENRCVLLGPQTHWHRNDEVRYLNKQIYIDKALPSFLYWPLLHLGTRICLPYQITTSTALSK